MAISLLTSPESPAQQREARLTYPLCKGMLVNVTQTLMAPGVSWDDQIAKIYHESIAGPSSRQAMRDLINRRRHLAEISFSGKILETPESAVNTKLFHGFYIHVVDVFYLYGQPMALEDSGRQTVILPTAEHGYCYEVTPLA